MDTTLITSTAAVLALGGFAIAEWRAREWRKLAKAFSDQFDVQAELTNRSIGQTTRALATLGDARAELAKVRCDLLNTRLALRRELRPKRSQAATRRGGRPMADVTRQSYASVVYEMAPEAVRSAILTWLREEHNAAFNETTVVRFGEDESHAVVVTTRWPEVTDAGHQTRRQG